MRESEKTDLLNKSLLKVHQESGPTIGQDLENLGFKREGRASKYSSISAVLKKLKPITNKHGIIIEQYPKFLIKSTASLPDYVSGTTKNEFKDTLPEERKDSYQWATDVVKKEEFSGDAPALLTTRITHAESGQFKEIDYPVRVKDSTDPQKLKSGHTYARRDSLELLFNVAESDDDLDDDGNLAAEVKTERQEKTKGRPSGSKKPAKTSTQKALEPKTLDPKAFDIKGRLYVAKTNKELEEMITELKTVKEGAKISEWDELSKESKKYLCDVWEEVNETLQELPKTEDKIKDQIPF
tara:strand:- start:2571 stop:3461 length:891 start_codon:yes stop_codon:yes gene_type:complete